MSETKEYSIDQFLQWVTELAQRDDRGTLAELRRGLSETTQDQAWEHLIPYSSDFAENAEHRIVWCTIGGLAAMLIPGDLSSSEPRDNIGMTMRALAKGGGDNDETKALKTFEPKFRRVLSCDDTRSLCEIVVGIGRTAVVKGISMNLKVLFWDLWNWNDLDNREQIRLRWAKQYFRVFEPRPESSSPVSNEEVAE
jgi:CRISPR type I-E-associated protein CasB/Cse2